MSNYIVTYTPLAASRLGKVAVTQHGHPPYADASCRREPDLEAVYPSITCVCRGKNFAPRLQVADIVVYLSMKGRYGLPESHWKLVAVLRVVRVFRTHEEAARWYRSKDLALPSDCLVAGNHPLPLEHTNRARNDVATWDAGYQARVRENGAFAACEPLWLDLHEPPIVSERAMFDIFGGTPPTRNPPHTSDALLRRLLAAAGVTPDGSHIRRPADPVRPNVSPPTTPAPAPRAGGCGSPRADSMLRVLNPRGGCG